MADLLEQGRVLFNDEKFYEAHEVWEDLWRGTAGPARICYQGLIQAAVGLHHLQHGNRRGAEGLLHRAVRNLERSSGDHPAGVKVSELIEVLRGVLEGFTAECADARPRVVLSLQS